MKVIVNGLEIGWDWISVNEMLEKRRLASLPEVSLGRSLDFRRYEPYGWLVPLRKVDDGRTCSYRFTHWLCRCTCWKRKLTIVLGRNLLIPPDKSGLNSFGCYQKRINRCLILCYAICLYIKTTFVSIYGI